MLLNYMSDLEPSTSSVYRLLNFASVNNISKIVLEIISLINHPYFKLCSELYIESNDKVETSKKYKRIIKNKSLLPDESSEYYNIAINLNTGLIGGGYVKKMNTTALDAYSLFVFYSISESVIDTHSFIDIVYDSITDKKVIMKYKIIQEIAKSHSISSKKAGMIFAEMSDFLKANNIVPMKMYLKKLYVEEITVDAFVAQFVNMRIIKEKIDNLID